MDIGEGIFAYKLYELKEQYGKLQYRIHVCEHGDKKKLLEELHRLCEEYEEGSQLLRDKIKACRSPAVSRMSRAQLDYREKTGELMKEQLVNDIHSPGSSPEEDRTEAGFLYAEYAMDFATLAMQQALIAAMTAIKIQGERDEKNPVGVNPGN